MKKITIPQIFWLTAGAMSVIFSGLIARADGAWDCITYSAPSRAEGQIFYTDKSGSKVNPEKAKIRNEKVAPLRKFVTEVSQNVDSSNQSAQECAFKQMLGWAKGKALTEEPTDFSGQREREEYTFPLIMIAIKLKAQGFKVEPLVTWLTDLTHSNSQYFDQQSRLGNLYVWSGAVAAADALLSDNDKAALDYQEKVWKYAIDSIRSDGFLDSELRRAGRATLYHVYSLSALLSLRQLRVALKIDPSAKEAAAIKRLAKGTSSALCNPTEIAKAAGGQEQQKFTFSSGEFLHSVYGIAAFGSKALENPMLGECGPKTFPKSSELFGGSFEKMNLALRALNRK